VSRSVAPAHVSRLAPTLATLALWSVSNASVVSIALSAHGDAPWRGFYPTGTVRSPVLGVAALLSGAQLVLALRASVTSMAPGRSVLIAPLASAAWTAWQLALEPYSGLQKYLTAADESVARGLALGLVESFANGAFGLLVTGALIAQSGTVFLGALLSSGALRFKGRDRKAYAGVASGLVLIAAFGALGSSLHVAVRLPHLAALSMTVLVASLTTIAGDEQDRDRALVDRNALALCLLASASLWAVAAWSWAKADTFWFLFRSVDDISKVSYQVARALTQERWATLLQPLSILAALAILSTVSWPTLPESWLRTHRAARLLFAVASATLLSACVGNVRASRELVRIAAGSAPEELRAVLVPEAFGSSYGGDSVTYLTHEALYVRVNPSPIARVIDVRELNGPDCVDLVARAQLEAYTRILMDQATTARQMACIALYFAEPSRSGGARDELAYGIRSAGPQRSTSLKFLVQKSRVELPDDLAVFGLQWTELRVGVAFASSDVSRDPRRPPHVHLAGSAWKYRIDESRDSLPKQGQLTGTIDERLRQLSRHLANTFDLHVSADADVPAGNILRVARLGKNPALYLSADALERLKPRDVVEPYKGR
jgi:hypothetical protein